MMSSSITSTEAKFEKLFVYLDGNGDGKISPAELQSCMQIAGQELSLEDMEAVVEHMDSDCDGLLGFNDFMKLIELEGEEETARSLREAFRVYAADGQDCITPKSLRQALRQLGVSKSTDECKVMIRCFDLNGDGVLSFEEFRIMMIIES